jgi:subtilisin-like proprotein convertase family protein
MFPYFSNRIKNFNMKMKITLVAMLFSMLFMTAQTAEQRAQIVKANNQEELQNLIVELKVKELKDQEQALEFSRQNNIPMFIENANGSFDQLMRVTEQGIPLYYTLDNVDAAISTRTNTLHNSGILGLNVEGQGMTAYVWDGGPVRINHQEFTVGSRASLGDGQFTLNGNSFHATHVSGTIAASGVNPVAKGMAPQAEVITNDWNSDSSEMAGFAATGALISNHSYGIPASSFSGFPELIGKYIQDARTVDQIAYNAPYYLPVYSAGNDGSNNTANSTPLGANPNYDKLTGDKLAKNVMTVANAQDAVINPDGSLSSVSINTGSSQGPSDDFRIKPDITGNGTQLTSTFDATISSYGTISGTSMAAPNIAGSILLLQQHYNDKNGFFMRAATLKGLALHTADDVGAIGPDPFYGWGLMNTMAAANTITENKVSSRIVEEELMNGQSYSITVESDNFTTLMASISWTDLPGAVNTNGANDGTPSLVNDLDVRITQNATSFEPWKLTGVNSNATGDNTVDNFERVDVANASGLYTITVTHKGSLVTGSQAFSLIITGEDNDFAITSTQNRIEACNDQAVSFPLEYLANSGFSDAVTLSLTNVPSGVTAVISNSSFTSAGNTTLDLSNLSAAADGTYEITVNANSSSDQRTIVLTLRILSNNLAPTNLRFPANLATSISTSETLDWDDELNAQRYQIQISQGPSFGRLIVDEIVDSSSYFLNPVSFNSSTTYFWRVKALNDCGVGAYTTNSFTTFACNELNAAVPSPIIIPDDNVTGIQSFFTVNEPNNLAIGKLIVEVVSTHEFSGDLLISLTSPSGTTVRLTNSNGCATPNLNVLFDDDSQPFVCNTQAGLGGYTGVVAPVGNLSDFNGENINGVWTLNVSDRGAIDLGTLNNWKITYCESPATASNADVETSEFVVYPNPSKGLFTVAAGSNNGNTGNAVIYLLDLNGRVLFTKEVQDASRLNETIDVQNLTNGLYLLQVQQGSSRTVKKVLINK